MGQFGLPNNQVCSKGSTDPPHSWGLSGKQRIWKRLIGVHGADICSAGMEIPVSLSKGVKSRQQDRCV